MIVRIEKLVYQGYGLARDDKGRVVFIPYTAPGDLVRVRLVQEKRDYVFAEMEELLEPSPYRVDPGCPHFGVCGSCQWLHVDYTRQLEEKRNILVRELARHLREEVEVPPVVPSPSKGYRRRVRFHIEKKLIGFRGFRASRICGVGSCSLITETINRALLVLYRFQSVLKRGREVWMGEDRDGKRLLVLIRAAQKIRDIHDIYHQLSETTGLEVGLRIQYPKKISTLGKENLEESLMGARVRYTFGTFFQANRFLVERLVEEVVAAVPDGSKVLELYSGCGTFTLPIARQKAESVLAVEVVPQAVDLLRFNAEINRLGNVDVIESSVHKALSGMEGGAFDVVVVDPPREGLGKDVVGAILSLEPKRVVYVSCNPVTFARDVAMFSGYRLESVRPLDMFPQTFHLEVVGILERC